MTSFRDLKKKIHQCCEDKIRQSILTAKTAMNSAEEAALNETKSSAGDKYETGRAMMHQEKEKNKVQLLKAINLKNELGLINREKQYDKIETGAFVATNHGGFYISIGLGKLNIDDKVIYAISINSPIGKVMRNKTLGDRIKFNNKEYLVEDIY